MNYFVGGLGHDAQLCASKKAVKVGCSQAGAHDSEQIGHSDQGILYDDDDCEYSMSN